MASLGTTLLSLRPFLLHPTSEVFHPETSSSKDPLPKVLSLLLGTIPQWQTFLTWSSYMDQMTVANSDQERLSDGVWGLLTPQLSLDPSFAFRAHS